MGTSATSNYGNSAIEYSTWANTPVTATSATNNIINSLTDQMINNVLDASTAVSNWGTTNYGNYFTTTDYSILSHLTRDDVEDTVEKILDKKEKEKTMTNDFSFGPYNTNAIRISPYGMAIKNKNNKWVSYNKETDRLMDVDVINVNIDSSKIFYKIPKAVKSVEPGDIILHNGVPVFVETMHMGRFTVVNPYEGTEITILPAQSPFGFDFVTVIMALTDCLPQADENNPFGNLLPFMLMDKDNSNNNLGLMLALSGELKDIDPMMMALLCNGSNNMSALLMMNMFNKKNKNEALNKRHASYGPAIEDKDE